MSDEDEEAIARFEGEGGLVLNVKQQARSPIVDTREEISCVAIKL